MDMPTQPSARQHAQGQVIVLAALAIVALLAMLALILDGGNAFAQQRISQNAADAASEAGAVVLMEKLVGVVPTKTGADVYNAVQASAATNGFTITSACYTDLAGIPIDASGNEVADCAVGVAVTTANPIPSCGSCAGHSAAGVRIVGTRTFKTFIGGVLGLIQGSQGGILQLSASTTATAIAGYVNTTAGPVLPVTFPVLATGCDNTGKATPGTFPWPVKTTLSVPLCGNSPGNVGWLDWNPFGGGASELAGAIQNSTNPPITTPGWYFVTQTGNINSGQVQSAMDSWNGKTVLLPIFDTTCDAPNGVLLPVPGVTGDCTSNGGTIGGNGSNQWYLFVGFAAFDLQQSFINGQDGGLCAAYAYPGLNTASPNSCLIGQFPGDEAVSFGASVGSGGGSTNQYSAPGVQLIR